MAVAFERNEPARVHAGFRRQMKTMNGVEKKEGAYAFVKILATDTESFEVLAFRQQLCQRRPAANRIKRLVADRRVRGSDDVAETPCHWVILFAARREQFNEIGEHFIAAFAIQGEGELRGEEAVLTPMS